MWSLKARPLVHPGVANVVVSIVSSWRRTRERLWCSLVVAVRLGWWCSRESVLWRGEAVLCRTATAMKAIGASSSSPTVTGSSDEARSSLSFLLPPPPLLQLGCGMWVATEWRQGVGRGLGHQGFPFIGGRGHGEAADGGER